MTPFSFRSLSRGLAAALLLAMAAPAALGGTLTTTPSSAREPDDPKNVGSDKPVAWFETMADGLAEAAKRDRPIVLVFPEAVTNRHEWFHDTYAQDFTNASDLVCVRLLPPQTPTIPAGATPQQRQLFTEAFARLQQEYNALVRKYEVGALPTVIFLSPDGETVLRSYTRTMETNVVRYMRALQSDFESYKKTRAALHAELKARKIPTLLKADPPTGGTVPPGPASFGPPIKWHETLAGALAEAGKVDKPIMLVLAGGDRERHEWFYGFHAREVVNASGVVAARVLPPAEVSIPRDAKPELVDAYRKLRERMTQEYNAMAAKYNVTSLPTILFLSPDGEHVLARHTRVMETMVVDYFKVLPGDFENHKKFRTAVKAVEKDKAAGAAATSGAAISPR
ncbi:MAG TPA: hypothetical protein PK280_08935 [Planctomycetota bacterium]|nr:hypothetical protein [Planctomycetota bacterium]